MDPASSSVRRAWCIVWLALLLGGAAGDSARGEDPALVISSGSLARREVVALGRDLEVAGRALDTVAAVNGSVRVSGSVGGDIIVLGGDVLLQRSARVAGDVFVLGGRIETRAGAVIEGRSVSYPTLGAAWLILLEGPSLGLSSLSRVVVGAKMALLAAWLGWSILLFAIAGREVLHTSQALRDEPFRSFLIGLSGVLSLFLTALLLSSLAAVVIGVPLLFLVIGIAAALKLWGLVAVFHAAGRVLVRDLLSRRWNPLNYAMTGLLVLGGLKIVPYLGMWVWTAASLLGIGATLMTKFGLQEPWLQGPMTQKRGLADSL
ncbi:MAG: polymer-forming cytoskeletal protein [Acidobacteriota bacterium]|nr:polymer-forming cytoskeletal protein [Acidobacteriota bacterium]